MANELFTGFDESDNASGSMEAVFGQKEPKQTFQENQNYRSESTMNEATSSLAGMFKRREGTFNSGGGNDAILTDAKIILTDLLATAKAEIGFANDKYIVIPIAKQNAGTHYSSVVLATRIKEKKAVAYNILMLTATGRKELTVNNILKAIPTASEQRLGRKTLEQVEREIVLPIDTFDEEVYKTYVENEIARKFNVVEGEGIYFINTFVAASDISFARPGENGIKLPTEEAINIFEGMFNSLTYINAGKNDNDFSFVPIIENRKDATLLTSFNLANGINNSRSDLNVSLDVKFAENTKSRSVNAVASDCNIANVGMYAAPILGRRIVKDGNGRDIQVNKVSPVMVITDINAIENTLKFTLAGVIAALPIIGNNFYPYAIQNSRNNWGTTLAYEFGDSPDESSIVDLKSDEYSPESVINVIDAIVGDTDGNMTAGLAIDIPIGSLSYGLSIFHQAADDDVVAAEAAGKKIVKALSEMTNGKFPANFDPLGIFANWTILPDGYFVSAKSDIKVPLANIDMAKLIELGVNGDILMAANAAQASNAKIDSYLAMLEALSAAGLGNAVVTGKITRAFFSQEFIVTLNNALSSIGLTIYTDQLVRRSALLGRFENNSFGYGRQHLGFTASNSGFNSGPSRIPNAFRRASGLRFS